MPMDEIEQRTRQHVAGEKATGASMLPLPFQFLAAWVGVWVARRQPDEVEHLKTVNARSTRMSVCRAEPALEARRLGERPCGRCGG
jgi:hypothetical protein